jgi:hypothetical protein
VSLEEIPGTPGTIAIDSLEVLTVGAPFLRGDPNGDRATDIADAIFILCSLFAAGDAPSCPKAADADDDGTIGIADPLLLLEHLFLDGPPPPAPQGACGGDPTADGLTCPSFAGCP